MPPFYNTHVRQIIRHVLQRLRECVQMEGGGGIILWSSFWEKISMLLTGKSLDEVLTAPVQSNYTEYVANDDLLFVT